MIRTPGRFITVGEACQKLNPHLFKKLDPEAKVLLTNELMEKTKKKRIRQSSKPLMNKLEEEYFNRFGNIDTWVIQSIRFRLGNGIWYKPDFFVYPSLLVSQNDCCKCLAIEVKGPKSFRGGFENLKVAASKYPWIHWVLVWKENGEWQKQAVLP